MFKRILLGMDDSNPSQMALERAIELAALVGAELRVLHVLDLTDLVQEAEFVKGSEQSAGRMSEGQALVDEAVRRAQAASVEAGGVLAPVQTTDKKVEDIVVEQADEWAADLIVLGTHGRAGLTRLLRGSVAEAVLRAAGRPVLLFPLE